MIILEQILILMPGFFGLATYKAFSGNTKAEPLSSSIMSYVIYSSFSWVILKGISLVFAKVKDPFLYKGNIGLLEFLIAVVISSLLGFLWFYKLKEVTEKIINKINKRIDKHQIGLSSNLIVSGLRKDKAHYLQITKEDKLLCSGVLMSEDISNGILIMSLDPTKSFNVNDNKLHENDIEAIIAYVDIRTGIIIKDIKLKKKQPNS